MLTLNTVYKGEQLGQQPCPVSLTQFNLHLETVTTAPGSSKGPYPLLPTSSWACAQGHLGLKPVSGGGTLIFLLCSHTVVCHTLLLSVGTGLNHQPNPNCEFKGHSLSESTLNSHPRGGTGWGMLVTAPHCYSPVQGFVRGGQDAAGMRRRGCASAWLPATRAFLLPGVTPASDSHCLPSLLLHEFMQHLWAFGLGKLNLLPIYFWTV